MVFERTEDLNVDLNPATPLIGIRVPDYPFLQKLVAACRQPLALTSANPSGAKSCVRAEEFHSLWPGLAVVYDGGELGTTEESRLGSTVVDLSTRGQYKVIRDGCAFASTTETLHKHGLVRALR